MSDPSLKEIDLYFLHQDEPVKSYLLALREHILQFDKRVTEAWKYRMPFYCYNGKMFCYLWVHKKHLQPYLGIVEGNRIVHPELLQEKRARMKILLFNPDKDIPVRTINDILKTAISFYK